MLFPKSILRATAKTITEPNPFAKYGLAFVDGDSAIQGPERPSCYGITPPILIGEEQHKIDLSDKLDALIACFQKRLPMQNSQIVEIVSAVFEGVTGKHHGDYSKIVHMDDPDWERFKQRARANNEGGRYDAIHFGGLIVRCEINDDRAIPLLFHELGHSLYLPAGSSYQDEKHAYHFQLVCTKKFEDEIKRLGLGYKYPRIIYFPTSDHERAYKDAETLFALQNYSRPELAKGSDQQLTSQP